MPTVSGLRRRGYTPESIRDFCARVGVAKKENVIDVGLLEHCVREDLNRRAPRAMAVLRPLKLVLTNYPEGQSEEMEVVNHPDDPASGTREVPFSREILHRARRLHGGSAEEVLPARARPRSAPAQRLSRDLHRGRQGRRRRDRRAALHLRSGDARRRCARRPQGQGDAALGVGRARGRRARCGSTIGCSPPRIRKARRRRPARVPSTDQSRLPRGADRLQGRADARVGRGRHARTSSSGKAISPPIPTRAPARRCSTAPCR